MKLLDGLYLYELVMLVLGVVLFLVVIYLLIYQVKHGGKVVTLVFFFTISIVMMGYPSIKSIQVQQDGITIEKTAQDLQSDPTNSKARGELEQEVKKIQDRPITDPTTLTRIATAQLALGDDKEAEQNAQKALQRDPNASGAREVQQRIIAVRNLDLVTSEAQKHPDDPNIKAQLEQTVNQVVRQPSANPLALAKIAKAQVILGQHDKAAENVNKALQIDPNLTEAKKIQTTILMRK